MHRAKLIQFPLITFQKKKPKKPGHAKRNTESFPEIHARHFAKNEALIFKSNSSSLSILTLYRRVFYVYSTACMQVPEISMHLLF